MPAVVAMLDSRAALLNLRRGLAPGPPSVVACRSATGVERQIRGRLVDAVVLGPKRLNGLALPRLRDEYPGVPVLVYGALRSEDAERLTRLMDAEGIADVVVEGVDDAVVGEVVRRHGVSRVRGDLLADAPRVLRLVEPLQRAAWTYLLPRAGLPTSTEEIAGELQVSREYLSRQFAAGGAPNLKRVIDLLRVVCAAELLANPGHDARTAAAALGFATASHLHAVARRITGTSAGELGRLGPRGVLTAFRRVGMRSRI